MSGFITGLQLQEADQSPPLSTGSPELDQATGSYRRGQFYFYYGDKALTTKLLIHSLASALTPPGRPHVVYMICGNYRRERIDVDTDALMELIEAAGLSAEEALRRVHVLTASSADQQGFLVDELEKLMRRETNISLVIVRGIFKLHKDDARRRRRHVVAEEVQRSIVRLRQLCMSHGVPLVASGREAEVRGTMPMPEASSFLKHLATVIVYLRDRGTGGGFSRAFIVKNPTRSLTSVEYRFKVNEMGRTTPPFRQNFNQRLETLRAEFQDALIRRDHRLAFDALVEAWGGELGAMSFAESMKMLDLMLLVASVDNRAAVEQLKDSYQRLEERVTRLEQAA